MPCIYAITPTYERHTQKADLTRLCQTFKHISNFHWILVEDANSKRGLIQRFLKRCRVTYTHLAVRTKSELQRGENEPRWKKARGVEQRNAGLAWLRENVHRSTANGVVYFIDDDNTYDLDIFEQVYF
jgi:galactosylgalactosylxylosylprotein 3-beta-glucuronosyltransferase 3